MLSLKQLKELRENVTPGKWDEVQINYIKIGDWLTFGDGDCKLFTQSPNILDELIRMKEKYGEE